MSHEIRTPMNGVLGMIELLLATPLDAKQRRFAETAKTSADALLELVNDILDLSKIEAGKVELERIDFELRQAVEEVCELFAERAYAKGVELAALIRSEAPTVVRGDLRRLRQILVNLVGNAIKFTDSGEVLVVVSVPERTESSVRLRFEVRDTGIGVAPEVKERIFDMFSQGDVAVARKYGGTGLGLAIAKQLAELMGGGIGVESQPGCGSTFWFAVVLDIVEDAAAAERRQRFELTGLRVLVVDPAASHREILHHQMLAWRMRDALADDGVAALTALRLAAARGAPFDVVLFDANVAPVDGRSLAECVRAEPVIGATRLVMVAPVRKSGVFAAVRGGDIDACITKPVRQSDLYECLAAVMKRPTISAAHTAVAQSATPQQFDARVLLTEDNEVNQEVARSMLESLGCVVETATEGTKAVELLRRERFDVVFMDCQMPVMDGYEAAAEVRRLEISDGAGRRLPIIALTANVLEGERERCLAAGMDDYLSKPLRLQDIEHTLARWLPHLHPPASADFVAAAAARTTGARAAEAAAEASRAAKDADSAAGPAGVIDEKALDEIRAVDQDGSKGLLDKFISMYLERAPEDIKRLDEALARGDGSEACRLAHGLKSSSAWIGAADLAAQLKDMEAFARDGALDRAAQRLEDLHAGYARVETALISLREGVLK